ncbi:MAG: hypothetical protein GF411_08560 [Candidatus Lokiarchaeota archaeon]|nr:hypothetical protein [Candidatus Lokiarchaeota archaeon]
MLREDPGWNMSGYVIKDKTSKIKIGSISDEIIYTEEDKEKEEFTKQEGMIIGTFFKKTF